MYQHDKIDELGPNPTDKLVGIEALYDLLGYEDPRSVMTFCKKNKIPTLKMGKRLYVVSIFLELFIESNIQKFVVANYDDPAVIINAVKNNDTEGLRGLSNKKVEAVRTKMVKVENNMSDASKKFLNK